MPRPDSTFLACLFAGNDPSLQALSSLAGLIFLTNEHNIVNIKIIFRNKFAESAQNYPNQLARGRA